MNNNRGVTFRYSPIHTISFFLNISFSWGKHTHPSIYLDVRKPYILSHSSLAVKNSYNTA